jgi:hypothetical protein
MSPFLSPASASSISLRAPRRTHRIAAVALTVAASLLASGLAQATPATSVEPPSAPPSARVEPLRPIVVREATPLVYVQSFAQLTALTKDDDLVSAMAARLDSRRTVALTLASGGAATLMLTTLLAFTAGAHQDCDAYGCISAPNMTLFYGGMAFGAVAAIAAVALTPWRSDMIDVLNEWNQRHVDRPLTLAPASDSTPVYVKF